jgi:very-short-patch-repair endonuclease
VRGIDKARELRKAQTDVEALLWRRLRNRQLGGYKFRRQHPIGRFVVDFVCAEALLIVELDGGQHVDQTRYDNARTRWLMTRGYGVARYWNDDVVLRMEAVLEDILMRLTPLACAAPHPNPLPASGERES